MGKTRSAKSSTFSNPAVRVLIADDDADTREAIRFILDDAGYSVLEAENGTSTLDALILSDTPLIVLLDLLMPHTSGYEVLLRVSQDTDLQTRHAYIILSAVNRLAEIHASSFSALVQRHNIPIIMKPFDIDVLLAAIHNQAQMLTQPSTSPRRMGTA